MSRFKVTYHSNNSGGYWWLEDEDWKKLEANGWVVDWVANQPMDSLRRAVRLNSDGDERWLGAMATSAFKIIHARTANEAEINAAEEFEFLLDQDPYANGCECCGMPHSFYVYLEENEDEPNDDNDAILEASEAELELLDISTRSDAAVRALPLPS